MRHIATLASDHLGKDMLAIARRARGQFRNTSLLRPSPRVVPQIWIHGNLEGNGSGRRAAGAAKSLGYECEPAAPLGRRVTI
jgi:hypothetical protein